jgi:hypothetical protein
MSSRPDEDHGLALMGEAQPVLRAGVDRLAAAWVVAAVTTIVDAWGRLDGDARRDVLEEAQRAGESARARVVAEIDALFDTDPSLMRTTPLEIVRSLRTEVTAVLAAAGVPEVERDLFEARAFPDDRYGIVPRSLGDLGDEELGPMLMAWGLGKSMVLRARAAGVDSSDA